MEKELITIFAIAESPENAVIKFMNICNERYNHRNLKFVDGYKVIQKENVVWVCVALAMVDKAFN